MGFYTVGMHEHAKRAIRILKSNSMEVGCGTFQKNKLLQTHVNQSNMYQAKIPIKDWLNIGLVCISSTKSQNCSTEPIDTWKQGFLKIVLVESFLRGKKR